MLPNKSRSTPLREMFEDQQAFCLNAGEGRYFIIHRLSQMKKRNPRKELGRRMKEISELEIASSH